MAEIHPFRGVRYTAVGLEEALCPPYDVIGADLATSLRTRERNAIFLELPQGEGPERYHNAATQWKQWTEDGTLTRDECLAFYVVEESYKLGGKAKKRRGFLAALGATEKAAAAIIPHERTLAKPKADRLEMLKAVPVNISPIFGVFADPSGAARKVLKLAVKQKPIASGKSHAGVSYRLWRLEDPRLIKSLRVALNSRSILIADGHHRYSVSREHNQSTKITGSEAVMTYLVPDEDTGLVVLPTHRIAERSLYLRAKTLANLRPAKNLKALESALAREKNPYAFGLIDNGFWLGVPKTNNGCRSGLSVEWIGEHLLAGIGPELLSYTPDANIAAQKVKGRQASAVLVKPFSVSQVRNAAKKVGLLPQKSTYFYPKIATGLVFRPLSP